MASTDRVPSPRAGASRWGNARSQLEGASSPDLGRPLIHRDWLMEKEDPNFGLPPEELTAAAEGAFSVLARYGQSQAESPSSPLARWRRSAIRIAASNAARRLREAARLKALQRTPYPLVLARIKLLLDRLASFKEQVAMMAERGGAFPGDGGGRGGMLGGGAGNRSRRFRGSSFRAIAVGAAGGSPFGGLPDTARSGSEVMATAITGWDLRGAGGHLISGPLDALSHRPSRIMKPADVASGGSDDDGAATGRAASRGGANRAGGGGGPMTAAALAAAAAALNGGAESPVSLEAALGPDFEAAAAAAAGMDDGGGGKMSLDKLLEELSTTMAYVSEFLRKVPEETRMEACFAAKMENYKKDQTVYRIGDPPERFHLILTGIVEIWTHPPGNRRDKTLIATLKKGQSFGEMAILNDEPRAEVATPTSNCTFLTFQRADLLACFGSYFRGKLVEAEEFFHSRVSVFQSLPPSHTLPAISHMMQSTFPAGKDWEPVADQQIYFIKSGSASLEALDRRFAGGPPPAVGASRGANAAVASAAAGGALALETPDSEGNEVLAAISIVDGRAVGTLGHEDELRRLRRALIPKKTVATLEAGSHFGGGSRILGEGELQSAIKVTALTDITLYHMHVDQWLKTASPELVRALRDDTAFKLTYYYGRQGAIGNDVVVGHAEASLAPSRALAGLADEESLQPTARAHGPGGRGKKKGKKYGTQHAEVDKVMSYMADLEAEFDKPTSKNMDLYKHGTPVERYYRSPLLCGTARGNALPHLISTVYPEGLAPLADKVETLASKAARRLDLYHGDQPAVQRMKSLIAPSSPSAQQQQQQQQHSPTSSVPWARSVPSPRGGGGGGGALSPGPGPGPSPFAAASASSPTGRGGASQSNSPARNATRLGPHAHPAPHPSAPGPSSSVSVSGSGPGPSPFASRTAGPGTGTADGGSPGSPGSNGKSRPHSSGGVTIGRHGLGPGQGAGAGPDGAGAGGGTASGSNESPGRRRGALTAAGFIWQRMRDLGGRAPPQVRQCLTYDEIAHIKAEEKRQLSTAASSSPGRRSIGGLSAAPSGFAPGGGGGGSGGGTLGLGGPGGFGGSVWDAGAPHVSASFAFPVAEASLP
ncbi:hypothetical protein HYH03_009830 [Edaphochlamys debaryana]|uniref:Cyclic nucleotide-binding domain-containing protein n=1 Tax=Edaphochlamys debaryana TaxID=47281 RepID=A0A836BY35_9CHLO|nr:hypothetical protein HYH03_009830 [Edaphochlamys debaryana]|eukprot:KAG2491878.1 hypothetical protein HYH03_009830 [Edaphochlamys debaryana]